MTVRLFVAMLGNGPAVLSRQGPAAMAPLRRRATALDLDCCRVDLTQLDDGRLLLFEANAATLVHPEAEASVLAYKNPHVARIVSAFETTPPGTAQAALGGVAVTAGGATRYSTFRSLGLTSIAPACCLDEHLHPIRRVHLIGICSAFA